MATTKTINYQNGKICKIVSLEPNDEHVYFGSTIQNLSARMATHRNDGKNEKLKDIKVYKYLNNINWNCAIILLENYPCKSKEELLSRENEHILANKDNPFCLNIKCSILTDEQKKDHQKRYAKENRENIKEKNKYWYTNNKEKVNIKHKQYYLENKEHLLTLQQKYYEDNTQEIKK